MKGSNMNYKNRYHKAAAALKWKEENGATYQEAADEFGILNKRIISNIKHLRNVRPDLYEVVANAELSYTTAYKLFKANVSLGDFYSNKA
jgi:hypothetical protein